MGAAPRMMRWAPNYVVPDFGAVWEPEIVFLPSGMGVTEATVTRPMAGVFLALLADDQRRLRNHHAAKLGEDMRSNGFRQTHQGMAFNRYGRFCDGQHRCRSFLESGAESFWSLVFFGVGGKEEMAVMDTNAIRTASDAAKVLGLEMSHNRLAVARCYAQWHRNPMARILPIPNQEILRVVDRLKPHLDEQDEWYAGNRYPKMRRAAIKAAILAARLSGVDPQLLSRFVGIICDTILATTPARDSAPKLLQQFVLNKVKGGGGSVVDTDLYLRTAHAILCSQAGKSLERLQATATNPFAEVPDEVLYPSDR